ncbi:MAG: type II toxin-antitoxin system HigB family toxin [Candidatus Marinimicrobia bacterium]|nr:type II toxin-antitoxin system HigB family toxin [Candidatus Neomarinimicrobiota bacterium]
MHVISKKFLREFWVQHPDAEQPLKAWHAEATHAEWETPADIKGKYQSASILKKGRVVFNIAGNKYRLIVRVHYGSKTVFIRFLGTHKEYDAINAEEV